jgi:spore maturation protein CgeB
MRFVLFYHSLLSDWNHGNAHFLRGIIRELQALGHHALVFEPENGWSRSNMLLENRADEALERFRKQFPGVEGRTYSPGATDLDRMLDQADVVLVHEWNEPELVSAIGRYRSRAGRFLLFFHDTHHRMVMQPQEGEKYDLSEYHGVLAFGEVIRQRYLDRGWAGRAWTWHEAADTALFRPSLERTRREGLVWVGNWGDGERSRELKEFLYEPVRNLGLKADIHGVRYPEEALKIIELCGARYHGWLSNLLVPEIFARHEVTVHVPRRPYVEALPGIPTIRVFEALACGIPLVCSPWEDAEMLFRSGRDYLVADSGSAMERTLRNVMCDHELAASLVQSGLETIHARHTCAHRVQELLRICADLGRKTATPKSMEAA